MSCGLESPAGFIIGSNRHCSLVMETHFSVHHHSLITGTRIRLVKVLDMKFHDLNMDRVSFVYDFMKFSIQRILLKTFYAKEL